jgi:hypothetical protein
MEEKLVNFKTAVLAKEKGFDEYYIDCYDIKGNTIPLYLQALLQKWLREVHSISILVDFDFKYTKKENKNCHYFFCIYNTKDSDNIEILTVYDIHCETYEEALEKGLYEALTIIPIKNDNKGKE